jgi:hypothetical protein
MSRAFSLAGFEVTLSGRFWVTPEEINRAFECIAYRPISTEEHSTPRLVGPTF